MKKNRTILAGWVIAALLLGLGGCAGGEGTSSGAAQQESQEQETQESEAQGQEAQESEAQEQQSSETGAHAEATPSPEPEQGGQEPEQDAAQTVELTGPAAEILDDIVLGWNLGNTLDSFSGGGGSLDEARNEGLEAETAWGNPKTSKELIDLVRDSGFNAVRVPVTWYTHMDSDNVIDEEWMDRVQEIVDYVIDDGMYCILNVHHDTGTDGWLHASDTNLEEKKEKFAAIWEQICARFGEYGDHLLFEGFNEILNDNNDWVNPGDRALEVTNELNQLFVDTVRASGGKNGERVLVLNTYCAGGGSQITDGFVLPSDSAEGSLIVSAHVYQPFNFTAEEYPAVTSWENSTKSLDSSLKNLYQSFVQKGIPTIVGEFGCVDKGNAEERVSWAQYYLRRCAEYQLKCFWWDNGSAYKLFNRRNLTVSEKNLVGMLAGTAKGEEYTPLWEDEEETDNLCADVDNWSGWVNSAAKATISYLPDGISVEVTDGGEEEWYVQPSYTRLSLTQGVYELSFDYTATADVTIAYNFQQNYDPYGVYISGSIDCTPEVQHYTATVTMPEEADDNVALVFNCGKHEGNVPFTLTVTNLSLVKAEKESDDQP